MKIGYFSVFMGGFLAMFAHIYLYAGRGDWLAPQRLSPALGNALIFAHLFVITVYIARTRHFHWLTRFALAAIFGTLTWWTHLFFYLYQTSPNMLTLFIGGFGVSLAFIVLEIIPPLNQKIPFFIVSVFFTAIAIYLPIYWSYQNFLATLPINPAQALLYFQADNPEHVYIIGIPFSLCLAFFANLPIVISSARAKEAQ